MPSGLDLDLEEVPFNLPDDVGRAAGSAEPSVVRDGNLTAICSPMDFLGINFCITRSASLTPRCPGWRRR